MSGTFKREIENENNFDIDIDIVSKALFAKLSFEGKQVVIIKKYSRNRSAEQNALMWKWLTEIGNELGNTKDDMHLVYKEKFLLSIFVRDDPDFAKMASSIMTLKAEGRREYAPIRKKVIDMTSTTDANVKQMTEYLTCIKNHAQGELGIVLTLPELQGLI